MFKTVKAISNALMFLLSGVISACLIVPLTAKLFGVQLIVASTGLAPTIGAMYLYLLASILTVFGLVMAIAAVVAVAIGLYLVCLWIDTATA